MSRTGWEWFAELNGEDQERYIKNFGDDPNNNRVTGEFDRFMSSSYRSFGFFISCSFVWGNTDEGHGYWSDLSCREISFGGVRRMVKHSMTK